DPGHPNNLAHTIHNVLAGRMRPFPDHMSGGCRSLITGLLRTDPHQRTSLQAMAFDPWLMQHARNHALAVGRLDLLEPLMAIGLHGGGEYGAAAPAGGVEDSQTSSRATSSGGAYSAYPGSTPPPPPPPLQPPQPPPPLQQQQAALQPSPYHANSPLASEPQDSPREGAMGRMGSGGGSGPLPSTWGGSGHEGQAAPAAKSSRSALAKMREYFKRKLDGGSAAPGGTPGYHAGQGVAAMQH
ncbi:hypothetical protein QJQ45_020443, partial [Haematococcus lacustris]